MYPDLDEFFDVPSATLDEARARNGFVLGTMVDRIARDWRLSNVTAEPLYLQFPRRCLVTLPLLKGQPRKWIVVPTWFRGKATQFMSSHYVEGEDALHFSGLPAFGFSHYRFGARSVGLAQEKLHLYERSNTGAAKVYNFMLRWLDKSDDHRFSKRFQRLVECLDACDPVPG
jgi:hypothetical protein